MDKVLAGRYEIQESIGIGGMAEVFLAVDQRLGRQVAVKLLNRAHASQEAFVERFKREAQSAASLDHPNIVRVYDWGTADDSYFIAMAYVAGETLRDLLRKRGTLPEHEVVGLLAPVASALAHAHDQGIVHRDIKPHNILIDESGEPRVTDFGIAQAAGLSSLTETSVVLGTAHYLSPEQATRQPIDARSDIYSLGIVAYELLAGKPPFEGETIVQLAMQHIHHTPEPLSNVREDVSPGLESVVMRCIEKAPEDRFPDAHALQTALGEAVEVPEVPSHTAATVAMATPHPPEEARDTSQARAVPEPGQGSDSLPPGEPPTTHRSGFGWATPLLVAAAIVAVLVLILSQFGGLGSDDDEVPGDSDEIVDPDPTEPVEQEEQVVPEDDPEPAPDEPGDTQPEEAPGEEPEQQEEQPEQEEPVEPEPTPIPEEEEEEEETNPETQDDAVQGFQSMSGNVACDGEFEGGTAESLVVPGNATCTLTGVRVEDDIQMNPGSVLRAANVEVYGNLTGQSAAELDLSGASFIDGNIQFERGGAARISGTSVTGNIQVEGNSGSISAEGNRVDGNVELNQNSGGVSVTGNTIDGNLECAGNDPPPTGGDNAVSGNREDQCSGL